MDDATGEIYSAFLIEEEGTVGPATRAAEFKCELDHTYGGTCAEFFAGLWERWKNRGSGELMTWCAIIVTDRNALTQPIHVRMPGLESARHASPAHPQFARLTWRAGAPM